MNRVVRVVLFTAACALLVPAIADARAADARIGLFAPTNVRFTGVDGESAQGQLTSPSKRCVRFRSIRITATGTGAPIATTTSDADGRFTVDLSNLPADEPQRIRVGWRLGLPICLPNYADLVSDFATIDGAPNGSVFSGVLFSSIPACEPGRLITLYEISSEEPVPVGFDAADANGAWQIGAASGTYEVRTDPALVGSGRSYTVCTAVKSDPWTYEEPIEEPPPEE